MMFTLLTKKSEGTGEIIDFAVSCAYVCSLRSVLVTKPRMVHYASFWQVRPLVTPTNSHKYQAGRGIAKSVKVAT